MQPNDMSNQCSKCTKQQKGNPGDPDAAAEVESWSANKSYVIDVAPLKIGSSGIYVSLLPPIKPTTLNPNMVRHIRYYSVAEVVHIGVSVPEILHMPSYG